MITPSQILKTTDITKTKGSLARFDEDGKLESKCALGVISCVNYKELTLKNYMKVSYQEIIRASLPKELQWLEDDDAIPNLLYLQNDIEKEEGYYWNECSSSLSTFIFYLNDSGFNLSFKEMGEFLEVTFGV